MVMKVKISILKLIEEIRKESQKSREMTSLDYELCELALQEITENLRNKVKIVA